MQSGTAGVGNTKQTPRYRIEQHIAKLQAIGRNKHGWRRNGINHCSHIEMLFESQFQTMKPDPQHDGIGAWNGSEYESEIVAVLPYTVCGVKLFATMPPECRTLIESIRTPVQMKDATETVNGSDAAMQSESNMVSAETVIAGRNRIGNKAIASIMTNGKIEIIDGVNVIFPHQEKALNHDRMPIL